MIPFMKNLAFALGLAAAVLIIGIVGSHFKVLDKTTVGNAYIAFFTLICTISYSLIDATIEAFKNERRKRTRRRRQRTMDDG